MKTIGIIGAMDEEIALIKQRLDIVSAKKIIGNDFYMGKMHGHSVVLTRCGIGKVNAAICTQVLIDMYGVDYIINTGVAGAISSQLKVGDVVVSDDIVHHDMDCTQFGYELGVIPRMQESYFKADVELINLAKQTCSEVVAATNNKAYVGRIASGDQFIASSEQKERISKNFGAFCAEMESAAIAQTAFLNKVPFVIVRAISDNANAEATMSFDEFVEFAAKNASDVVEQMVKAI